MHTEEEARKTWCPKYQVTGAEEDHNRSFAFEKGEDGKMQFNLNKLHPNCCCLGSQCGVWRGLWRKIVKDRICWDREELASRPTAPGKEWERVGYCGLAGEPK